MKKIIVSMLFLLPLGLGAQEMKIAFVDINEIYDLMPETTVFENQIVSLQQQINNSLKELQDEYVRKYTEFTAQSDSLTDNIRRLKIQEIQEYELRITNYQAASEEDLARKREELFMPIQEKFSKALDSVGEEHGYTIFNPQVFLYRGKGVIDATELVKAKLGLK